MQRTLITLFSLMVIVSVMASAQADYRSYEAPLDTANWTLNGSPLQCDLTQDIPKYGVATFRSSASRKANMNFDLSHRRYRSEDITEAILSSEPPIWKHDKASIVIGDVVMYPGSIPVNIEDRKAWGLLTQLEQGMFPTFAYDSFLENKDQISVSLSAVNFQPVYDEFLDCVNSLLPYSFYDIAETFVYFEFNRSDFTRDTRESLSRIGAWLAVDKTMELVLLAGHTDSKGKRRYNLKLGKRRAEAVKSFFMEAGIDPRKIKTQTFADIQPQSSNDTPEGRARNRRVMIKMVR